VQILAGLLLQVQDGNLKRTLMFHGPLPAAGQ
jgi:hypothetical protein